MRTNTLVHPIALLAVGLSAVLTTACASAVRTPMQQASLDDPRMLCAKAELFKLGYQADASVRKPGRLIAIKSFRIVGNERAAILAEVDSTNRTFDVWARVLPREGGITVAELRQQPPVNMLADAMQVADACVAAKQ